MTFSRLARVPGFTSAHELSGGSVMAAFTATAVNACRTTRLQSSDLRQFDCSLPLLSLSDSNYTPINSPPPLKEMKVELHSAMGKDRGPGCHQADERPLSRTASQPFIKHRIFWGVVTRLRCAFPSLFRSSMLFPGDGYFGPAEVAISALQSGLCYFRPGYTLRRRISVPVRSALESEKVWRLRYPAVPIRDLVSAILSYPIPSGLQF
ncbi:hypothetical protein C8R44DRAFT_725428 [Mycena epipterygia]|nr:hypothetical protein C8R44DRAFT_725428 [Mycena epipterygia]